MTDGQENQDQGLSPKPFHFIKARYPGPRWVRDLWDKFQLIQQGKSVHHTCSNREQAESIFGKALSDIKYVIWAESGTAISSDGYERWETRYDDQGRVSYHGHIMDGAGDDRASEVDLRKRELRRADP